MMDFEQIRARLRTMKTYEDASEFFGDLGYSYAGDAPAPTRNWPESVQRHGIRPQYIAQHGDFKVIFCEMPGGRMLRTVQRAVIDQLAREHAFFLVVFHHATGNMWDFVNVSVIQDGEDKRIRRIARRISITDAERVSNRLYTTAKQLEKIDLNDKQNYTALQVQSEHNKAFDVEKVTKDFYKDYIDVFDALSDDIAQLNASIKQDAEVEALRLLDRLMFLYFIQKKGWLSQQYDYLYARFQDHAASPDSTTYYEQVIIPLFYALANREGHLDSVGDVPFLNGGLFQFDQTSPVYRLKISNSVFQMMFDDLFEKYNFTVEEDMPDDRAVAIDPEMLGKVFESLILNLEQEKDLRKVTGSYYTPRTIVSFMCQQSLREYIVQRWRDNFRPLSPDSELALRMESKAGQQELRSVALDQQEREYQQRIMRFVEVGIPTDLSKDEARQVRRWLLDVRVVDPAVGSGAFLVGMLQEIVRLVGLLDEYTGDYDILNVNYVYDLKRDIIGKCLYGVDIQPQAVQICELRLWLSLIVEYEPEESGKPFESWVAHIEPLPNLSYLVRQGNSLIEQVFGETVQLDATGLSNQIAPVIKDIQDKKAHYYDETDRDQKHRLDTEILRLQISLTRLLLERKASDARRDLNKAFPTQLAGMERDLSRKEQHEKDDLEARLDHLNGLVAQAEAVRKRADSLTATMPGYADEIEKLRGQLGAFIWRVDFGEVFHNENKARQGFDIAIANPPYIRQEKIKQYKADFQNLFPEVYTGTADLYVYFYAQALRLLRTNGVLTFISPNKFLLANYGKPLRQHLKENTSLELLIDFGDLPVFDATTYPFITMTRHSVPSKNAETRILNVNDMATLEMLTQSTRDGATMKQFSLRLEGWKLADTNTQYLTEKIRGSAISLDQYVNGGFFYGIKTGLNDAFVITQQTRDNLIAEDPHSVEIIKPWLRGRDIKRWTINSSNLYVLYVPWELDIENYPSVLSYLMQFKQSLSNRPEVLQGRFPWYALSRYASEYVELFSKPKIMYPHFNVAPNFAYDEDGYFGNDKTYIIPDGSLFLLGLLNSHVSHFFLMQIAPPVRGGYMELRNIYVGQIPIPEANFEQHQKVEAVVRQLLQSGKSKIEIQNLERELNLLVYQIYQLSEDEIKLIEAVVPAVHDLDMQAIREANEEEWLVIEVTAFDDKTGLPERGIVRYQTSEDDDAYLKADGLKQDDMATTTFYVFYNEKES